MKKKWLLNNLLPAYFVIGMLKGISILSHVDYFLSIFIQLFFLFNVFKKRKKVNKNIITLYIINMLLILTTLIYFLIINCKVLLIINRILPLISIFGFVIVDSKTSEFDLNVVIKKTINMFLIIGAIIIIDATCYMLFSKNIWPPVSYLGSRFSGPFYDSNFMAITYGVILITILYLKKSNKKIALLITSICILLAKSWSTIIFLIVTITIHLILKINFKNLFFKQLLFIFIDVIFIIIMHKYIDNISKIFVQILSGTNFSLEELIAKFKSFEYRIVTQYNALKMFKYMPFGHGPRTIVSFLKMDIHNSYLGFLFEQGLFGILLQVLNMPSKKSNLKFKDTITTFIIIVALFINIHYSSIFVFVLSIIFYNEEGGSDDTVFNNYASI